MIPQILVICTANRCRSPMAGALLEHTFADAGVAVQVETAGLLDSGLPQPEGVNTALAHEGIEVSGHTSRKLTTDMVARAGLVIAMERSHVREVVTLDPDAWPRTFTLKELVRRGEHIGPRRPDESAEAWLADAHRGRRRNELLGADDADNLADPMGGPQRAFDRTAVELVELSRRLTMLLTAPDRTSAANGSTACA